jgi:hypothetical protein
MVRTRIDLHPRLRSKKNYWAGCKPEYSCIFLQGITAAEQAINNHFGRWHGFCLIHGALLLAVVPFNHRPVCRSKFVRTGLPSAFHPEQLESDVNMTVHKALVLSVGAHVVVAEAAPIDVRSKPLRLISFNSTPSTNSLELTDR